MPIGKADHLAICFDSRLPAVPLPVFKADLISAKIEEEIKRHERAIKLFAKLDGSYGLFRLSPESFDRIAAHLHELASARIEPVESTPVRADLPLMAKAPTAVVRAFRCKKCDGNSGQATPGRYGAYFLCLDCQQNNAAPKKCDRCKSATSTTIVDGSLKTVCVECESVLTVSPAVTTKSLV